MIVAKQHSKVRGFKPQHQLLAKARELVSVSLLLPLSLISVLCSGPSGHAIMAEIVHPFGYWLCVDWSRGSLGMLSRAVLYKLQQASLSLPTCQQEGPAPRLIRDEFQSRSRVKL